MIPKIIHYCWFGKGLMPQSQKQCIKTWKRLMPDYTFMRWDESTFDYTKYEASRYAYEVKKYALVSDVCRYNVLTEYGGIYLDTDVELFQRFDEFLKWDFFSGIELYPEFETEHIALQLGEDLLPLERGTDVPHMEMLTSTMGCVPNCEMIRRLRDYYNDFHADADIAFNYRKYVNNDRLVARYATDYGFRYKDETQYLQQNMVVFGTGIFGHLFCPNQDYRVSYHHNAASWEPKSKRAQHELWFDKIGLLPLYQGYRSMKKWVKKIVKPNK